MELDSWPHQSSGLVVNVSKGQNPVKTPQASVIVQKPLAMLVVELLQDLQLLRDSLRAVREGRDYHLLALSGRLRALLTEKRRDAAPLMFEMAARFGVPMDLYCGPDTDEVFGGFPDLSEKLVLHASNMPMTRFQQFPGQTKTTLAEVLDRRYLRVGDQRYALRDVVDWYANKLGGVHHARGIPDRLAPLLQFAPSGSPTIALLVSLADATLAAGCQLIRKLMDFELHIVFAVPEQSHRGEACILDLLYEDTTMRVSVMLDGRLVPSVFVRGLQGGSAQLAADRLVDWRAPRYLVVGVGLDDDLSTRLFLAVDGETVGRIEVPSPLFVLGDPLNYDMCVNKRADGEPQQFSFMYFDMAMFGEMSPLGRAQILMYFHGVAHNREGWHVVFTPLSFGRAQRGTTDLSFTGNVLRFPSRDVVPREEPETDG